VAIAALAGTVTSLQGQVGSTPRALGAGGALVGLASGNEAIYLNPANLGLPLQPQWSISFPQIILGGTLSGLATADFMTLLDDAPVDESRQDQILQTVPEAGAYGQVNVVAPLVSVQFGRIGVGVAYGTLGRHGLSRDVVELILTGHQRGRSDYSVDEVTGFRSSFWDVTAAYGSSFGPVAWGVAGRFRRLGTLGTSWLMEPRIDIPGEDVEISYVGVFSRGGSGFGVDLGAAYQPLPSITLSAAVGDAIAFTRWSDDLFIRNLVVRGDEISNAAPLDLMNRFERSERRLTSADQALARGTTPESLRQTGAFPAVLRLGGGWEPSPATRLGLSLITPLMAGERPAIWRREAAIGIEQHLRFVRVRTGMASDLAGNSMLAGGMSLGPVEVGVGRLMGNDTGPGYLASFGLSAASPHPDRRR
jgi:hypothetical protein